jgi:Gas vesicle synthesis protein GvpL/GvpF
VTSTEGGTGAEAGGLGWYVYGIVPAADADSALAGNTLSLEGEHGLEIVPQEPLAAIVTRVPLDEFGEDALPARLNDLAWLEEKTRAHEEVLERALSATTVVPFRFCTIYRREDDLRDYLSRSSAALRELIEQLRGRVELGVKSFADRASLEQSLRESVSAAQALQGEAETVAAGRAYLLARQAERVLGEEVDRFKAECVRESHAALAAVAEEARLNRPQSRELSGRTEEMLLNGAYLVPGGDDRLSGVLHELADRYGKHGVAFELTGPWPPYNFVPHDLGAS